jgi:hypothetical protein
VTSDCGAPPTARTYAFEHSPDRDDDPPTRAAANTDGISFYGFQIPRWAVALGPQPGENLLAYRDRVLPIAKAAIAPQRSRVARSRDDFALAAHLDPHQLGVLDTATQATATAIEDRVLGAVLGGDFAPETFKPMMGVELARDVVNAIDQGNHQFLDSLTDDQRAQLAQHPFDFGDYLLFSTPWEEALGFGAGGPAAP